MIEKLTPDMRRRIADLGETVHDFAQDAQVNRVIFYRNNPITPRIAHKIAAAYAKKSGITIAQARALIIIESPPPVAEKQRTPLKTSDPGPSRRQKRRRK